MEQNYVHWRACTQLEYLRAELIEPNTDLVATIKEVKCEEVSDNKGNKEVKPIAYFEEQNVLPMVLNVTNCKIIEKMIGSGNIFDWVGHKIQIFATVVKVSGESVPCLRIRPYEPKTAEVEYKCCVCGKIIDKKTHDASVAKFGKSYCSKQCCENDIKGKDLLA